MADCNHVDTGTDKSKAIGRAGAAPQGNGARAWTEEKRNGRAGTRNCRNRGLHSIDAPHIHAGRSSQLVDPDKIRSGAQRCAGAAMHESVETALSTRKRSSPQSRVLAHGVIAFGKRQPDLTQI